MLLILFFGPLAPFYGLCFYVKSFATNTSSAHYDQQAHRRYCWTLKIKVSTIACHSFPIFWLSRSVKDGDAFEMNHDLANHHQLAFIGILSLPAT
jgi:hypothetical protein